MQRKGGRSDEILNRDFLIRVIIQNLRTAERRFAEPGLHNASAEKHGGVTHHIDKGNEKEEYITRLPREKCPLAERCFEDTSYGR